MRTSTRTLFLSLTLMAGCDLDEILQAEVGVCDAAPACEVLATVTDDGVGVSRVGVYGHVAVVGSGDTSRVFELTCADDPVEWVPEDRTAFEGLESAERIGSGALVQRMFGVDLVDVSDPLDPRVVDTWDHGRLLATGGVRFVGLEGSELVLGSVSGGRIDTTSLGCVAANGQWGTADCALINDAVIVGEQLVVQVYDAAAETTRLHVYGLSDDQAVLQGSAEMTETCRLESDGTDVVAVGIDQLQILDLDGPTLGDAIRVPEPYLPVRVGGGDVVAAGQLLYAWDLQTGEARPTIALPAAPSELELAGPDGELAVLSVGGMPLITVDRSCR
jgi:hypothetical protein